MRDLKEIKLKLLEQLMEAGYDGFSMSNRAKCEIKGNWAITPHGRKSIHANGFRFLD